MNAMMKPLEVEENDSALASTLTTKQAAFAREYAQNGGKGTEAATAAGYAQPETRSWGLIRLPHIAAAIRAEQSALITSGAARGIRFMTRALDDDSKLSGAVKFQCAKWLAEAAGHGARATAPDDTTKPQGEMSLADLDAFVTAGRAALTRARAEREAISGDARDITHDEEARKSLVAQGLEPS